MALPTEAILEPRRVKPRRSRLGAFLIVLLLLGVLGSAIGLFGLQFLVRVETAVGSQMLPTIASGDRLIVSTRAFRRHLPERGDLVLAEGKPGDGPTTLRVAAVAGDTVEVRPGSVVLASGARHDREWVRETLKLGARSAVRFEHDHIFVDRIDRSLTPLGPPPVKVIPGVVLVNGAAIDDTTTREDPDYAVKPVTLPADTFFALGDNRNEAVDSHVWGPIPHSALRGKVLRVMR